MKYVTFCKKTFETGGWRLEAGGWRLEAGGWRLEAGGWRRYRMSPDLMKVQALTHVYIYMYNSIYKQKKYLYISKNKLSGFIHAGDTFNFPL
ncbi:hypothetical protein [Enterobacter hormaechei]|uniref:hypothetical protein n=1 Tax=Enterobacter hormaechei TaxID=158836 RepID=UPI0015D4B1C2|nr:hypothetical protein [Enterobacter hormaechei]